MGKYVFERYFDCDDQNNAILSPLSTAMIQTELFQGNKIYTVVLSILLNCFPSMSLSIRSTVKQKVDTINSL